MSIDTRRRPLRERGAVAVEMAIVLPLLLLIIGGMIDLGRLFYVQTMVTNAAREGARMKSLGYADADADTRVLASSPGLAGLGGNPTITYIACPAGAGPADGASATVSAPLFEWLVLGNIASLFGASPAAPDPTSTATMRCFG